MKHFLKFYCLLIIATATSHSVFADTIPAYKKPKLPIEARVKDLLSRMTEDEKIGQLSTLFGWEMYDRTKDNIAVSERFKQKFKEEQIGMLWGTLRADPWTQKTLTTGLNPLLATKCTNAIQKYVIEHSRLGIPLLLVEECPHGVMAIGSTVFPTELGQASTWDTGLINKMAAAVAREVRLQGSHVGYGPILDLAREPRWSRFEETFGEDPTLAGAMGEAVVKGFQGQGIGSGENIISTLKHFTAYGVPDGGHNGGSNNIGMRELTTSYLPPFKQAVKAGALSVMTAYNSIDGIPCTGNDYLINQVLRKQWGFNGFIVSDLGAISGLQATHHVAASEQEAAAMALNSGVDSDLGAYGFGAHLRDALKQGLTTQAALDTAVARVLRLKFAMGLFENPYVDAVKAQKAVRSQENVQLATQVARESIILLKNDKNILPLSHNYKNVLVVGPNADNVYNQLGDYTAPQDSGNVVTVLNGLKAKMTAGTNITYVKGCAIRDTTHNNIDEAVAAAKKSDVAIVVLGGSSARDFKTSYEKTGAAKVSSESVSDMESGEGYDRSTLDLLGDQLKLLQKITATGTPVVLVLIEGRPLNINWAANNVNAIVNAWYPGQAGGSAIADVLLGNYNPAGRLPASIPRSVGQLPVYYDMKRPAPHNYVEESSQPLYPFGYGLSYSKFEYGNLVVNTGKGEAAASISLDVKNTSDVQGDEVVQLYVTDDVSSVVTPAKQLKKFARVNLKANESKHIQFDLKKSDLELLNKDFKWVTEPGSFSIGVGASSEDIRLQGKFEVGKGE